MSRGGLPILMLHALDDSGPPLATEPARFAATLAALADAGFRTVDLADWIARGRPAVDRAFALTFDDGLRSIKIGAENLARHGFTATAFLITGRMGGDNAWPGQPRGFARLDLLAWSELADLRAAGFRFMAHGRTHARLDRLDDAELDDELRGSRSDVEQRLGEPCPLFAYPYGVATARVRSAAARHFTAGFGTRLELAGASSDPFRLGRIDAFYARSGGFLADLIQQSLARRLAVRRVLRRVRRAAVGAGAE